MIAPHPDDETLGCGGAILNHKKNGDKVYCIFATARKLKDGWSEKQVKIRENEVKKVSKTYKFEQFFSLDISPNSLDQITSSDLIATLTKIFKKIKPEILYVPYYADAHSDHQTIGKIFNVFVKWFRFSYIKKIYSYETISETDFNFAFDELNQINL